METWAYMEDIPYPVSRGSYRYKTRVLSPKQKTRFRLVYIKSGVKTPLLSDMESKSKLRYGLDVIDRRPQPEPNHQTVNTPVNELRIQSAAAPPPTANTNTRIQTSKSYVYIQRSKAAVDFKKLHPYHWNSSEGQDHLPPVAPDAMYRHTYIDKVPEKRTPPPQFPKMKRGLALYNEEDKYTDLDRPHTVQGVPSSDNKLAVKRVTFSKETTDNSNSSSRPVIRQVRSAHINHERSIVAKSDMGKLLNIKSVADQRNSIEGPSGCLHAKVKHSITFIKKVEKGELMEIPYLARPLNEKGKYRPHSRTRIPKTPPAMKLPETTEEDNFVEEKNYKSAEVYLQFVKKNKTQRMFLPYSNTPMGSPGMTEILSKYMTPGAFEDTPRSIIPNEGTQNPPASRCSTHQSQNKVIIPEWAEEEKQQNRNDLMGDNSVRPSPELQRKSRNSDAVNIQSLDDSSQLQVVIQQKKNEGHVSPQLILPKVQNNSQIIERVDTPKTT